MVSEQRSCDGLRTEFRQLWADAQSMMAEMERENARCISEMQRVYDTYTRRSKPRQFAIPEESSTSPFQRQSRGLSDSKVSSAPKTESVTSLEEKDEVRKVKPIEVFEVSTGHATDPFVQGSGEMETAQEVFDEMSGRDPHLVMGKMINESDNSNEAVYAAAKAVDAGMVEDIRRKVRKVEEQVVELQSSSVQDKEHMREELEIEVNEIEVGDVICEMETDKATFGFVCLEEGLLAKILAPEGSRDVAVGQPSAINVEDANDLEAVRTSVSADARTKDEIPVQEIAMMDVKTQKTSFNRIKAVAIALRNVPEANAYWDVRKGEIILCDSVDISIAVAIEKGLMTPIVRNADQKLIVSSSSEVKELASLYTSQGPIAALALSKIRVLGTRLSKEGSIVMTRSEDGKELEASRNKIGIG